MGGNRATEKEGRAEDDVINVNKPSFVLGGEGYLFSQSTVTSYIYCLQGILFSFNHKVGQATILNYIIK